MLTLLSPAGLWALAALALPAALHLWRRPPRTVRLGSLRFLERQIRHRPRDLRWHERLLLAARLLLLALLALMLTRPHWQPRSLDVSARWVLLDPAAAPDEAAQARLRTLTGDGYETHFLLPGFPRQTTAASRGLPAPDLWSLLREADAGLPAGSSLAVFTPGRLASLRGDRPLLSRCQVEWVITPAAAVPEAPEAPSDTPPLGVLIVHDASHAGDARYLAAAVRAVAQVAGRKLAFTEGTMPTADAGAARVDWAFWLNDQPPPAALAALAANFFTEAPGNPVTVPGWLVPSPGADALNAPVRLWRRVPGTANPADAIVWTDGYGQPLLTRSGESGHWRWQFFSRFDPDWTDLPRTTALPAWLRALLLPVNNAPLFADPARDFRLADPAQLATATGGPPSPVLPLPRETPGLQGWCWLLAAILFGLERLLSHRRRSVVSPVPAQQTRAAEPALAR